ncbi:MAG: DNA polymerase III subunit delta [bacterium]|nr:DNA polymerase III subunit delta [bacterium]
MAKRAPATKKRSKGPTPDSVLQLAKKGEIAPLYLLHGAEELEKESALANLVETVVEPAARTFNLDIFRGEDLSVEDVVGRAASFPMMAPRRLVVIKRAERLNEPALRELLPFVENPSDTTVLIFTAEKFDARKKFFSELRKRAVVIEFKPPYDNEIPAWIQKRVSAQGKRIEPKAVTLLQLSAGSRPQELANEIEKLVIYTDTRDTITQEDVQSVTSTSRGTTVFELADAVGKQEPDTALAVLKQLLEQGENPVGVVAMLIRHIAILRKARWLQAQRLPRDELATQLKVPPFFLSGYLDQATLFSDQALWNAYEALLNADNQLKSRSRNTLLSLSQLICRMSRKPS